MQKYAEQMYIYIYIYIHIVTSFVKGVVRL